MLIQLQIIFVLGIFMNLKNKIVVKKFLMGKAVESVFA